MSAAQNTTMNNLTPGMAYVPEAPSLSLALHSFGPSRVVASHTKNVATLGKSLLSFLKSKFEVELESKEMENLRWGTFVSFDRQVGGETVMSGRDLIVQVKD